jgi:hypothetical protein
MVQPVIACGLDWQFGELLSQSWDIWLASEITSVVLAWFLSTLSLEYAK